MYESLETANSISDQLRLELNIQLGLYQRANNEWGAQKDREDVRAYLWGRAVCLSSYCETCATPWAALPSAKKRPPVAPTYSKLWLKSMLPPFSGIRKAVVQCWGVPMEALNDLRSHLVVQKHNGELPVIEHELVAARSPLCVAEKSLCAYPSFTDLLWLVPARIEITSEKGETLTLEPAMTHAKRWKAEPAALLPERRILPLNLDLPAKSL